MADILSSVKAVVPKVSLAGVSKFAIYAGITILVMIIVGGAFAWWAYSYIMKKKYNITIQFFAKINGKYEPTVKDKAMEIALGDSGDRIIFIQKAKRYRWKPTIQMGKRTYWLAETEEGELINIGIEDIDLKLKELLVNTTDTEARANRVALQKASSERFKKKETFWSKYGTMVMNIIYIVVISIALVFVASKLGQLVSNISQITTSLPPLLEKASNILNSLNNVCTGALK